MWSWLIGGFQRAQSAVNAMIYRVTGSADTVAPTIVSIFRGN